MDFRRLRCATQNVNTKPTREGRARRAYVVIAAAGGPFRFTAGSDQRVPVRTDDRVQMRIWDCAANANQRFLLDEATGVVSLRAAPTLVLDGFGTSNGSPAILWTDWGGANQRWKVVP